MCGQQRGRLQQLHPCAYSMLKKLRAALGYDPIRNKIGQGYEIGAGE